MQARKTLEQQCRERKRHRSKANREVSSLKATIRERNRKIKLLSEKVGNLNSRILQTHEDNAYLRETIRRLRALE